LWRSRRAAMKLLRVRAAGSNELCMLSAACGPMRFLLGVVILAMGRLGPRGDRRSAPRTPPRALSFPALSARSRSQCARSAGARPQNLELCPTAERCGRVRRRRQADDRRLYRSDRRNEGDAVRRRFPNHSRGRKPAPRAGADPKYREHRSRHACRHVPLGHSRPARPTARQAGRCARRHRRFTGNDATGVRGLLRVAR
jgi:hypothetical protein